MNMIALDIAALGVRPIRTAETPTDARGGAPLKAVKAEAAPARTPDGHEHPLATAHF